MSQKSAFNEPVRVTIYLEKSIIYLAESVYIGVKKLYNEEIVYTSLFLHSLVFYNKYRIWHLIGNKTVETGVHRLQTFECCA